MKILHIHDTRRRGHYEPLCKGQTDGDYLARQRDAGGLLAHRTSWKPCDACAREVGLRWLLAKRERLAKLGLRRERAAKLKRERDKRPVR